MAEIRNSQRYSLLIILKTHKFQVARGVNEGQHFISFPVSSRVYFYYLLSYLLYTYFVYVCVHVHTITCVEDQSLFFASTTMLLGIKSGLQFQ